MSHSHSHGSGGDHGHSHGGASSHLGGGGGGDHGHSHGSGGGGDHGHSHASGGDGPKCTHEHAHGEGAQGPLMAVTEEHLLDLVTMETATTPDESGFFAVHHQALKGHSLVLESLLDQFPEQLDDSNNERQQTPLHWACIGGKWKCVQLLVKRGADANFADIDGYTSLHHCIQYARLEMMHYLVDVAGADLNRVDKEGHTLAHWAAYFGNTKALRYLLAQGISMTRKDGQGRTPMHWACVKAKPECVRLLLSVLCRDKVSLAAVTSEEDNNGHSPLWYTLNSKQIPHLQTQANNMIVRFKPVSSMEGQAMLWRLKFLLAFVGTLAVFWSLLDWKVILGVEPASALARFLAPLLSVLCWGSTAYIASRVYPVSFDRYSPAPFGHIWGMMFMCPLSYAYAADYMRAPLLSVAFYSACVSAYYFLYKTNTTRATVLRQTSANTKMDWEKTEPNRFCTTCIMVKSLRSKHCKICDQCVSRFDHHCPWVDACVAQGNNHLFLNFLLSALLAMLLACGVFLRQTFGQPDVEAISWSPVWPALFALYEAAPFMMTFCLVYAWYIAGVGALAWTQFNQAFHNITTNEMINRHRLPYVRYPNTTVFSNGVRENFRDFYRAKGSVDWSRVYHENDGLGEFQLV